MCTNSLNTHVKKIASTWIDLCDFKNGSEEHENRFWAWIELDNATYENPELAWQIIINILKDTDSTKVIENLGAGPLENMMCQHDIFTMKKIKSEISRNFKLLECMTTVWLDSADTNLYKEFYKLAGIPPVFDKDVGSENT